MNLIPSSSWTSSMYRRFRRLRLTVIVYACGSLCGILLFLNFNDELKRLILQKPTFGPEQEHSADGVIMGQLSIGTGGHQPQPPSGTGTDPEETSKLTYLDENSAQSKARQKLNSVASGSATQSMKDPSSKLWFMWHGSRFPTVATSSRQLWWEENPESDRIVEQLMYVTVQDTKSVKAPPPSFTRLWSEGNGEEVKVNLSSTTSVSTTQANPRLKTILLYYGLGMSWGSHIISGRHVFLQQKCPVNACRLTGNRSQMNEADLVVFKDVFMSPKVRRTLEQLWVIYMLECPLNTQNFIDKNVFNLTATYRHDSDIVTPYEKWVYYDDTVRGLPQGINYAAGKTKKVAWFVSNCVAKNNRLEYARELGKYIQVDIYGACGSHSCSRANARQCFDLLSQTYKFYLAFENSNCRDYISEKFFVNGLGNNVLPIVMGAHPDDYRRAAPHKSYIHVDDFPSPSELGKYLQELDQDDTAYNSYFAWKGTGEFVNTHFFCRLCAMVHYADRSRGTGSAVSYRTYKDFNDWWRGPNVCTRRSWRNQIDIFANKTKPEEMGTGGEEMEVEGTSHRL